ncbi:MAG TPA: GNAT family N-acetyltransferase [Planctomycetota bacterium]|nr:GNAT family N-acetyltransferase [Planctomycetota bacterium]
MSAGPGAAAGEGWTARPATAADRPDHVRLFNACFRKRKDERTFAWKYEHNPDGPAIARVACAPEGAVVGAYAYMPRRFLRDGRPVVLMQASDAMTDEGWRGRGIFTGLDRLVAQEAGEQGASLAFAYSGRQSLNGFLRNGWRIIGHAHQYRRAFRHRRGLLRLPRVGRAAALAAPLLDAVTGWRDRRRLRLPDGAGELRRIEHFDESVERLFQAAAPRVGLVGVRDARWLNWRYVDTPTRRQECWGLFRTDRLAGYVVGEMAEGQAWLVDHLAADGEARLALLAAFTALARRRGVEEASALLFPHDAAVPLLAELGWRGPLQRKPFRDIFPFIVRACRTDAAVEDFTMARWHLSDGDRDAEHLSP